MIIGILAFQGDYVLHQKMLNSLKVKNILVRNKHDLDQTNGLIIPGGESTVISKMICENNMFDEIILYSNNFSIYGTCAGAIIMGSKINDTIVNTMSIIDVKVIRNAWGRQIDSFSKNIKLSFSSKFFKASFIRAPKFKVLSDKVIVLSKINSEPLLIKQGKHLISSFHPELGEDLRIHKFFIDMVLND